MKRKRLMNSGEVNFWEMVPRICVFAFCAYLCITLLINIFVDKALTNYFVANLLETPNRILVLASVVVIIGILFFIRLCFQSAGKNRVLSDRQFLAFLTLGFCVIFFGQLFMLDKMWVLAAWDVETIVKSAERIANGSGITEAAWYFSQYPYNLVLVYTQALVLKIGGWVTENPYRFLLGMNAFGVCLSVYMATLCVFRRTENRCVTVITALFGTILIGFSPWISVPYSDTAGMLFVAFAAFFYVHVKKKGMMYALVSISCLVGYLYKATVLIVYIAFLIITVSNFLNEWIKKSLNWKNPVMFVLSLVLAFAISMGIRSVVEHVDQTELDPNTKLSITHFLMMGNNYESDGIYWDPDVYNSVETEIENRQALNIQITKNRLRSMGVKGYLTLLLRKNIGNYNDGTFGWEREGIFNTFYRYKNTNEDEISLKVKSLYYLQGEEYSRYQLFGCTMQVIWLAALIFICFCVLQKIESTEAFLSLSLIGISLYLLIFESRARYLLLFTPCFITLAGIGMQKAAIAVRQMEERFLKQ